MRAISLRSCLFFIIASALVLTSTTTFADAEPEQRNQREKSSVDRGKRQKRISGQRRKDGFPSGQKPPRKSKKKLPQVIEADSTTDAIPSGFVFIDGNLIPRPYIVSVKDGIISANDQPLPKSDNPSHSSSTVSHTLEKGGFIVAFDQKGWNSFNATMRGWALLEFLASEEPNQELFEAAMDEAPSGQESLWRGWLENSHHNVEIREFAQNKIAEIRALEQGSLHSIAAVRRLEKAVFPLTILGLILSVIAFGHLLRHRPEQVVMSNASGAVNATPEAMQFVSRTLCLLVALSALDLIWTILAWQAGQMRELNPVARWFIDSPMQLISFKIAATLIGAGLLFALKKYRTAQLASWWMCMVCTLLMFRWVSMTGVMS